MPSTLTPATSCTPGWSDACWRTASGKPALWVLSTKSAVIAPATVLATLAFSDEPSTVTALIRATPIISAAAVAAVRRGLRTAFSRPSRPGSRRENSRPTPDATGLLTSGESMAMPMKASRVPRPSSCRPPSRSALVMASAPTTQHDRADDGLASQGPVGRGSIAQRRERCDPAGAAGGHARPRPQ